MKKSQPVVTLRVDIRASSITDGDFFGSSRKPGEAKGKRVEKGARMAYSVVAQTNRREDIQCSEKRISQFSWNVKALNAKCTWGIWMKQHQYLSSRAHRIRKMCAVHTAAARQTSGNWQTSICGICPFGRECRRIFAFTAIGIVAWSAEGNTRRKYRCNIRGHGSQSERRIGFGRYCSTRYPSVISRR